MFMTSVVWTDDTFENDFKIYHKLEKYFKESLYLVEYFSNYFLKKLVLLRYAQNNQAFLGIAGMNGLTLKLNDITLPQGLQKLGAQIWPLQKLLGVLFFKGDHDILRLQPWPCIIYLLK